MIPRRILGASHWLGAPAGWKPDVDGDCGHLAIRTQGDPRHGRGWCESAWEPTPKELEQLNAGGSVILRVVSWQPPVAVYVEEVGTGWSTEVVQVHPSELTVCPTCEEAIGPLTQGFCQNAQCPVRIRR